MANFLIPIHFSNRVAWLSLAVLIAFSAAFTSAEDNPAPPPQPSELSAENSESTESESPADSPSDAERIAELQETIEQDNEQLQALERELNDPESEYARAEQAFGELNDELDRVSETLEQAKTANETTTIQRLEREIASIERKRKLAEARFDLAIEDRRTVREQMQTLRSKIKKDQSALDELTGDSEPEAENSSIDSKSADESAMNSDDSDSKESDSKEKEVSSNEASDTSEANEEEAMDGEIAEAEQEADEKESEAEAAQQESQSIADRIADLQKLIAQEQKELSLARKKVELADAAQVDLTAEITKRQAENATQAEIADLRSEASDASRRLIVARSEVNAIVERLNDHRAELGMLQSEHIVALHEAEKKRQEAIAADERVESLRNPFAPRNILQWLIDHGLRLLVIAVGMFLLNRIASFFSQRSVRLVSGGTGRGTKMERENRARTLVGVFQNAATVGIFITGFLMMLEEVGANITVLMGGVAVVGLAVAFGAQNLIKDYFYGFVMLLENQYMLNDSIRIGSLSGQVERITLRMTVLRDSSGVVHFIPNGTINSVSNETHGWSRAVCEVAVGYDEDLEHVLKVLAEIGEQLHADPKFRSLMLEAPSSPAIESLGETAIHLKMTAKTTPNKHGAVKQEWLRRIKRRFSELGIHPAYPQRTLRLKNEEIAKPLAARYAQSSSRVDRPAA